MFDPNLLPAVILYPTVDNVVITASDSYGGTVSKEVSIRLYA